MVELGLFKTSLPTAAIEQAPPPPPLTRPRCFPLLPPPSPPLTVHPPTPSPAASPPSAAHSSRRSLVSPSSTAARPHPLPPHPPSRRPRPRCCCSSACGATSSTRPRSTPPSPSRRCSASCAPRSSRSRRRAPTHSSRPPPTRSSFPTSRHSGATRSRTRGSATCAASLRRPAPQAHLAPKRRLTSRPGWARDAPQPEERTALSRPQVRGNTEALLMSEAEKCTFNPAIDKRSRKLDAHAGGAARHEQLYGAPAARSCTPFAPPRTDRHRHDTGERACAPAPGSRAPLSGVARRERPADEPEDREGADQGARRPDEGLLVQARD